MNQAVGAYSNKEPGGWAREGLPAPTAVGRPPCSPSLPSTTFISFTMLFLLFVYFLSQSNLGGDASPAPLMERRANDSCNDLNQCRTIWNILWSCLSTVILCTWVTLHPNITIAPDTRDKSRFKTKLWYPLRDFVKNKLLLFLWALIAPEYILAWAVRQYLRAKEIREEFETRERSGDEHSAPARKWTVAHGFFLIMGGFHLYSLPEGAASIAYPPEMSIPPKFVHPPIHSREGGKAEHPLGFKDLSAEALAYFAPTEREIKDKGKADMIAKTLVILQTSWFVAQCLARVFKGLPLTELEVVALAYATMNAFTYLSWWNKPKDVECPVRVYKASNADVGVEYGETEEWESGVLGIFTRIYAYIIGQQDDYFLLSEESQVPMFWSGHPGNQTAMHSMTGAGQLAIAFGGIHFIALASTFPSNLESLLWKLSCIAMTVVPLTVSIISTVREKGNPALSAMVFVLLGIPLPLTALLYIFSRIATLVMAFTTLRELPSNAFKTPDWANFIPHL